MSLTLEQVQRIAHLARIEISETEARTTQSHLNGIFQLIEQMQAVDTTGVEPMAHAQDLSQRLRDDVVSEEDRRARTVAWEKRYWEEFSKRGVERVVVVTPPGEG